MADVQPVGNQLSDAAAVATPAETKTEIKCLQHHDGAPSAATSDTSSDNQLTHEDTEDEVQPQDVDIDAEEARRSDFERRLTWIGEGLLDGEGLEAVEQLMNLPSLGSSPHTQQPSPAPVAAEPIAEETDGESVASGVERSGSKLLAFLAKEEGFKPTDETPPVAPVQPPPPTQQSEAPMTPHNEEKRQSKLLDFLATDIGERYLDDLYQEEDSDPEDQEKTPEEVAKAAADAATAKNNKLLAFLARERGERVHEVEKVDLEVADAPQARRPEPYTVPIRLETSESAAAVVASEAATRGGSPEPTPEATTITSLDAAAKPVQPSAERSKLANFVKNVQPPARPQFVIYNPDDVVTISGSEGEEGSPTSNPRDFRLKKRSQAAAGRIRFENPGLDLQTGIIRQAVVDHYGREELLDFVPQVDERSSLLADRTPSPLELQHDGLPPSQRQASPPLRQTPPPPRHESPQLLHESSQSLHESPQPRRESPQLPLVPSPAPSRKHDGRLANFLRKFSSKSKSGSDSGSRGSSRTNSPDINVRQSAPPPTHAAKPEPQHRPPFISQTMPSFMTRTSVESEPEMSTPLEAKMTKPSMFAPSPRSVLSGSENGEPSSKRVALMASLRQLLEDCENNELSDISMVRISILLSTVNQIVRDDLRKERPAQTIMRRLSMHIPGAQSAQPAAGVSASWVRSDKEQEEYERGHTTTIHDIASHVEKKSRSPETRVVSPQHTLLDVEDPVADDAMQSFTEFETAQNVGDVIQAFDRLLNDCGISDAAARTPLRVYNHVKSALYSQFSFRQKQLFRLLDAKLSVDVYKRQPCLHKRVCVVGAGPVGLRAAVELALLGAQVVVIDKRKAFNRENILHMWPWVVQDLSSLGAKVFFPQFCHSSAYFHVGTRQLQCILLKVALLLGVKAYPGTSFEGLASPDSIVSERKSYYTVVTKPQIPWQEFTAVLGACGTKDKLSAHAGIKRFVFSRKEAIGLVCYFPNLGTNEEKKVNEFSWTIQFKQRMFAKMRDIGIDLENVVYYRGEYHYIVMTPKRNNLLQQGVLKINYPSVSDLVAVDNIDPGALNDYVSRIISFFEIPQKSEFARVRLFDFSARTRAAQAATVLASRGKKLYVGLIGDALMEPFWPEGLGTCRGFLGAMDACWMVAQIGKQSDEQILADRELGYRIVQHISGFQRDDLQKNVRKYNVDPASRYTVQYPATITY